MPSLKSVALGLATAAVGAKCVSAGKVSGQTITEKTCLTSQGPFWHWHVPTYTQTDESLYTITKTHVQRQITTVTPAPIIVTQTTTEVQFTTVTGQAPTDSIEVEVPTTTVISTTAPMITSTVTSTTTSTTTLSTAKTVQTPNGFLPILDSVSGLADDPPGVHRRAAGTSKFVGSLVSRAKDIASRHSTPFRPPTFPEEVNCDVVILYPTVTTETVQGRPQTVTAATPVSVSTETETNIITSTTYGPTVTVATTATTTQTIYETFIPVTMTTTTTTVSSTASVPTSTAYAVCGDSNFGDKLAGSYITLSTSDFTGDNIPSSQTTQTPDLYSCCNLCAARPHCEAGSFVPDTEVCTLFIDKSKSYTSDNPQTFNFEPSARYAGEFFNGPVGQGVQATD